jgi:hypothetical protein
LKLLTRHPEHRSIQTDREKVEGVTSSLGDAVNVESRGAGEATGENGGVALSFSDYDGKFAQLLAAQRCGYVGKAEIEAQADMVVTAFLAVRASQLELGRERGVGSGQHASFAGGHVL